MTKKKVDYFNQVGIVLPSEYNWYEQFQAIGKDMYKKCRLVQELDVGKVLGLARAYASLQENARNLALQITKLVLNKRITFETPEEVVEVLSKVDDLMEATGSYEEEE